MEMLHYLREREYGVDRLKKNVNHLLIEELRCVPTKEHFPGIRAQYIACKFSRNKNNLHTLGCATIDGKIIIKNTTNHLNSSNERAKQNCVHIFPIIDFVWAEPQMKLITSSLDRTSILCDVQPSGTLIPDKVYSHGNTIAQAVKFSPGSSDIFCFGYKNGLIKIWDTRINNNSSVLGITYAHGIFGRNPAVRVGSLSNLIFKDSQHILSSSSLDNNIKMWDLRKIHSEVQNMSSTPILTLNNTKKKIGYMDMVINPNATHLYASNSSNAIDCYLLDSTDTKAIFQYSGFKSGTSLSKLSINNDGRYLFSGCKYKSGVIWVTDFPYVEKPMFEMSNYLTNSKKELSTSDWCADPTCLKLVTCSYSSPVNPKIWTIFPLHRNLFEAKCNKTSSYKKLILKKNYTVPIKCDSELKDKYRKQTEENMNNWYLEKQNSLDVSALKTCQVSPEPDLSHSSLSGSKQIPVETTQTSCNKRKREPSSKV